LQLVKPTTKSKEVLVDDVSFSGKDLATAKESENRLLYVSPVLKQDLHISGIASVSVKLAASKSAANFSVWLVALPWSADEKSKITDNIITRGWADPQNYKSITKGIPLKAGKFYDLKFRSEERRVGKESRSKGSEDEQRKRIE